MLNYSILLAEAEGGLFDFDATLPFMALQIVLLTIVLNALFYGPITSVLDDRNTTIRNNLKEASSTLAKAEEITKQYEEQLATAREQSQAVIIKARKEANEFVAAQIEEGKLNAEKLVNETTQQLLLQKEQTLQTLEAQLDILSDDIKKKLLTVSVIS